MSEAKPQRIELHLPDEPSADQLLAVQGIATAFGWNVHMTEQRPDCLLTPEYQAKLDAPLNDLVMSSHPDIVNRGLKAFIVDGISLVRDAFALGGNNLAEVKNVSARTAAVVTEFLLQQYPEMDMPKDVNMSYIARYTPSIEQLTWRVVDPISPRTAYMGEGLRPSLADILNTPLTALSFSPKSRTATLNSIDAQVYKPRAHEAANQFVRAQQALET